jgi:hypothetical protein
MSCGSRGECRNYGVRVGRVDAALHMLATFLGAVLDVLGGLLSADWRSRRRREREEHESAEK